MKLNGLSNINIELTNCCNKHCWICGRRQIEKENPNFKELYNHKMDFSLVKKIALQVPEGIVVQLHNNGEPLMYSRFGDAVKLFNKQITNIVTNGKLLITKFSEIVDNLDTLSISIFEKDVEADEQFNIIKEFIKLKGSHKPYTTLRLIGDVDRTKYENLGCQIITRVLHNPLGSFDYKKTPTIPETGICRDFLNHMAINYLGDVSICVRFDPYKVGVIGNVNEQTLSEIWNSPLRLQFKKLHIAGKRNEITLCSNCDYYGVPIGNN